MKISKMAMATAIAAMAMCGRAFAQQPYQAYQPAAAPTSQTAYDYGSYYVSEDPAASPSDAAPVTGGCCDTGCNGCCDSGCGYCCEGEPFTLFGDNCALQCRGIEVGGWISQGFTWNPDNPANRFNGPVTFNDRSNEYQMNQAYLFAERAVDTGGCGWDIGGRVDALYGTDSRFTMATGLDDNIIMDRDARFYKMAIPQMYAEVGYNDLSVKLGHFYTIIGYEVVTAPDNFFYSHAYTMQYGEPFTHTGALASFAYDDNWSITGGITRGWDNWEDNNDDIDFLGGLTWTSCDGDTSVAWAMTTGAQDDAGNNNRYMQSVVVSHKLNCRTTYVLQSDYGHEDDAVTMQNIGAAPTTGDAEWYGINQYLFYEINPCLTAGVRYEWFADDDGVRVAGLGTPRGIPLNAVASHWQAVSCGLNYKWSPNVMIRPEARWDWVDPLVQVNDYPFDDFTDGSQFLLGTDVIVTF